MIVIRTQRGNYAMSTSAKVEVEEVCRDYGRPGCLVTPDPAYELRFDDIGEEPIKFCAECGKIAKALEAAFIRALETRGPDFVKKLGEAIDEAELTKRGTRS